MKYYIDTNGYCSLFDPVKGVSIRGGIDGKEPFWKPSVIAS